MPYSLLFLYRIFAVTSFRRLICACGAFVVAFATASTFCFILECSPIRDFWIKAASTEGGHCIHLIKFLLVNGCINTVTDFALLVLVSYLSLGDCCHFTDVNASRCLCYGICEQIFCKNVSSLLFSSRAYCELCKRLPPSHTCD